MTDDPEVYDPAHPKRIHSDGDAYWDALAAVAASYAKNKDHKNDSDLEAMRECVADLIEVASGYDFIAEILKARRAARPRP